MNEERLSILRMLSEGKITAEEAEELLAVLETSEKVRKKAEPQPSSRSHFDFDMGKFDMGKMGAEMGRMGQEIGRVAQEMAQVKMKVARDKMKTNLEDLKRKQEEMRQKIEEQRQPRAMDFPETGKLKVSVGGGDLTITGIDGSTLTVEGDLDEYTTQIGRTEDMVTISTVDDTVIKLPRTFSSLHVDVGGGDFLLEDVTATEDMVLRSGGGDVTLKRCQGGLIEAQFAGGDFTAEDLTIDDGLNVRGAGGDITVSLASPLTKGTIILHGDGGGDVTLRLPEESAFEALIHTGMGGEVFTDLPFELVKDKSERSFEGTLHGGGAKVTLFVQAGGDARLLKV